MRAMIGKAGGGGCKGGNGGNGMRTTRFVIWKAESMIPVTALTSFQAAPIDAASSVSKPDTYRPSTRVGVLLTSVIVYPTIFVKPVSWTAQM